MANICNNQFSIPAIDLDECIGTSLATINANFNDLKENNCLSFNEASRIETNLVGLSAQYYSLSSILPRFARAWVNFEISSGVPVIQSSYNITRVSGLSTGMYALSFSTAFPNVSNYALIGSCKETEIIGGTLPTLYPTYVWVQPTTFTATSAGINIRNQAGSFIDPEYVSIVIYNN